MISPDRVEEDPAGRARPPDSPKGPSLTVSAMLPSKLTDPFAPIADYVWLTLVSAGGTLTGAKASESVGAVRSSFSDLDGLSPAAHGALCVRSD
jgi:hypothetical protein